MVRIHVVGNAVTRIHVVFAQRPEIILGSQANNTPHTIQALTGGWCWWCVSARRVNQCVWAELERRFENAIIMLCDVRRTLPCSRSSLKG